MTKQDLVENIRANCNLQRKEAEAIVTSVLDIIKESLASGEEVKLSGFGKFVVQQKRDRTGRNPQTGEPLTIAIRAVNSLDPSPSPHARFLPSNRALSSNRKSTGSNVPGN
jgi:integration host factor subunit alpha